MLFMKAKNMNSSAKKSQSLIRNTFAMLISEKKELSKITVSELVKRANINRSTFYSHYDDIYGVAEEYENELIDNFFNCDCTITIDSFETMINNFFDYIYENDYNFKMLCASNDFLFLTRKLTTMAGDKLITICKNELKLNSTNNLELEINVFIEGLVCEYIKYCRGYSSISIEDLRIFTINSYHNFLSKRTKE